MQTKIESISIIDDDKVFHFTMKIIIKKVSGIDSILQFYDGEEAIDFFKKNTLTDQHTLPGLIFLDLNMPYMDGWQFMDEFTALKIKDYHPQLFIVTSSNNADDIEKAEAYNDIISGYRVKPISKDDFLGILREVEID